jgi:hypothetical protein
MRWGNSFVFVAIYKAQAETGEVKGHYLNCTGGTSEEMIKRTALGALRISFFFFLVAEAIYKAQTETGEVKNHYLNCTAGTSEEMVIYEVYQKFKLQSLRFFRKILIIVGLFVFCLRAFFTPHPAFAMNMHGPTPGEALVTNMKGPTPGEALAMNIQEPTFSDLSCQVRIGNKRYYATLEQSRGLDGSKFRLAMAQNRRALAKTSLSKTQTAYKVAQTGEKDLNDKIAATEKATKKTLDRQRDTKTSDKEKEVLNYRAVEGVVKLLVVRDAHRLKLEETTRLFTQVNTAQNTLNNECATVDHEMRRVEHFTNLITDRGCTSKRTKQN